MGRPPLGGPDDDTLDSVDRSGGDRSGGDCAGGGDHVAGDTCVVDPGASAALFER